jgi:broad specificity phosphatase PhoE
MSETLPVVYVARHGNTAWTLSGQHTGLTDLPLTPDGERNARRLGERLKGLTIPPSPDQVPRRLQIQTVRRFEPRAVVGW